MFVHLGNFGGANNLFLRCVHVSIGDVLSDSSGEQEDVLLDDSYVPAQRLQCSVPNVDIVNRDATAVDVVETRNKIDNTRLAASRRAEQGHYFPRLNIQVELR